MPGSSSSASFEGRNGEALQRDSNQNFDRGKEISSTSLGNVFRPNLYLKQRIKAAISDVGVANDDVFDNKEDDTPSRTELDSHANMIVVGRHALIVNDSGQTADAQPFSPDYSALEAIKIVDAVILYTCPYKNIERLLLFRNCLYVPSMSVNLVPPFCMREAGLIVQDIPKFQSLHLSC